MYYFAAMNKTLFFSDLDSTLIYSGYPEHVCVEYNGTQEVTYMTSGGVDILNYLTGRGDFVLIPCTLRSYEQTSRINFIKYGRASLVICDNGFSIYDNGVLDVTWDHMMNEYSSAYPTDEVNIAIENLVAKEDMRCRIKVNRSVFFTLIFDDAGSARKHYEAVSGVMKKYRYRLDLQGRKLYVIPDFLDKALAVEYICRNLGPDRVITAGDSSVDKLFVELGETRILPCHSLLEINDSIITESSGIQAGEEILNAVRTML